MEPVGLAVGVVGLAGLFSSCLEAVAKFDSYKNSGRDSRSLATSFDVHKHRFEQWGRAVGIEKGKLSDTHHPALDDEKTLALVYKLLANIQDFCSVEDDVLYQQPTPANSKTLKDGFLSTRQGQRRHGVLTDSKRQKVAWAPENQNLQTTFSGLSPKYNVCTASFLLTTQRVHHQDIERATMALRFYTARTNAPHPCTSLIDGPSFAEIRAFLRQAEEEAKAETKRDLRAWLGCPSPNDVYDDSIQKRLDGTCEWMLARPEFRRWLSPDALPGASKLLWINGPAGYGKTILCAKLIEVIPSITQTPTAHFFLSSKSEGRDDPFLAIRSWLSAITFQSQAALDAVRERPLVQHEQVATRATIIKLFREVVQTVPCCTVVLDGLDECTWVGGGYSGSHWAARFLEELRQAIDDTTARVLIVSRNEPEIRQGLTLYSGFSEYTISLEDVTADNTAYSRSIVDNKLSNKDESTKLSISQKMVDRCGGQFQWLRMQEDFLRKGRNQKQLERDIDETPAGLEHLYDRNWERIEKLRDVAKNRAFSLISAISCLLGRSQPIDVCNVSASKAASPWCNDPVTQCFLVLTK
ncbi:hypothetical protein LZ32DRAFT_664471 [Colletotrichum eremochloae]|nr:hypothetical protein LZ32DRAFT_664471 [Colletotrichum eremochloae]